MMVNALLLSNSTMPGTPFFTWPQPWIREFLPASQKELVFIPYAAVTISYEEYASRVKEVFHSMGFGLKSVHEGDPGAIIDSADGIVIGGGNTFALLNSLYKNKCM